MNILKQLPQDFVVKEVSSVEFNEGNYSYFELWKKDLASIDALMIIAKALKVNYKDIGFAGTKDKKAVTTQKISVRGKLNKKLELDNLKLKFLGYGNEPLSLGDLEGNKFELVLRNLDYKPEFKDWTINYFDDLLKESIE